ncbi:hypothetical protein KFU94_32400 [Chloroflexi bacterium TSY]|nr:hypothetical protein [Chloroflexi bacterium TSY]
MTSSITVPLDIPEVEVLSSEITSENHLLIRVESTQKQQHVVYAELRLRVHLAMVKKLACAISQFLGLRPTS